MLRVDVGHSVELVSNFSRGLVAEEVIFLAIEVDAQEVHLQQIPDVLLASLLSVEKDRLVLVVDSPSRHFVYLNPERIVLGLVLVAEVDALNLDIDVVQPIQQQFLEKTVFFFVLPL